MSSNDVILFFLLQQLAAEQHKMPQPPSSNLCHPQQIEEKEIDVETSSL